MPAIALPASRVFIVTLRRSARSEPEAYYMPAPTPSIAELRVRRLAKAPDAAILSIRTEQNLPGQRDPEAVDYCPSAGSTAAA